MWSYTSIKALFVKYVKWMLSSCTTKQQSFVKVVIKISGSWKSLADSLSSNGHSLEPTAVDFIDEVCLKILM